MPGENINQNHKTEGDLFEDMPSFEEHMRQLNSEQERTEKISEADKVIDRVFDKIGRGRHEGYFSSPEKLVGLTSDTIQKYPREAVRDFTSKIKAYETGATEEYRQRASALRAATKENILNLQRQGLVGDDTIKVFLDADSISERGRGWSLNEYNTIQSDFSRQKENPWLDGLQTYQRYRMQAKDMADSLAEDGGDVAFQREISGEDTTYDPDGPFYSGQFIHVNSNKPRESGGLRCYISASKTADPGAVLHAWKESVQESPLKDSLYFKFATSMNSYKDGDRQRPDDIIIYKTDNIDDNEFKQLLQDFQKRCNEMSPDLLPEDESEMPSTTQKIANGISIAGEPKYVNDYLRYSDHKEGKHSWTTFIDKMTMLSASVAANRLGVTPDSINTPGLEAETKKVFREFMLLSKINPDTMLPIEYGEDLPSWAKLGDDSNILKQEDSNSSNKETADHVEETPEKTETISGERRLVASGEKTNVYKIKKGEKENTLIESEYIKISGDFAESHDIKQQDFDLRLAMSVLATDLALVDAVNGRNLDDNEQKAKLLEDYSALRARLEDPKINLEEKQLISEYLQTMDGKALRLLKNCYEEEENDNAEKDKIILEELKSSLKVAKESFVHSQSKVHQTTEHLNELLQTQPANTEELQMQIAKLKGAIEELEESVGKVNLANEEYEVGVYGGRSSLGENDFRKEISIVKNNEQELIRTRGEIAETRDRIARIERQIFEIESLTNRF